MNPVAQQLLLVKYLYQRGEDALAEKGMFSAGLAVSLFQDAVESLAWTIAKEVDAEIKERDGFEAYWDAIKLGKKNPTRKELPPKTKMRDLNKARVTFKHYGIVPAIGEAARLQIYTEQFLVEACKEFFGVDFAALSLAELVRNPRVLAYLKAAEQALANDAPHVAVEESAKAHTYVESDLNRILPAVSFNLDLFVARTVKPNDKGSREARRAEEIETVIQAQRNFIVASALGIQLADFIRFKQLGVFVFYIPDGVRIEWAPKEKQKLVTPDDAKFAVRYVTNFAIALERTLAGVKTGANLATW